MYEFREDIEKRNRESVVFQVFLNQIRVEGDIVLYTNGRRLWMPWRAKYFDLETEGMWRDFSEFLKFRQMGGENFYLF